MIKTKQSFFSKYKVFFLSSGAFLLYYIFFAIGNFFQEINPVAYEFLAADYSVGFCSRILPGAVYHALIGSYNITAATIYVKAVTVLFILLVGVVIQIFYDSVKQYDKKNVFVFISLLLFNSVIFSYFLKFEGSLDIYWMILFLIGFLFSENKVLVCLCPVICVAMMMVYTASILCAAPLLCLILLLKAISTEKKNDKTIYSVVFVVSVVCALGAFAYFTVSASNNLLMSFEELRSFLEQRGAETSHYFQWALFPDEYANLARQSEDMEVYTFPAWVEIASANPLINVLRSFVMMIYYNFQSTNYKIVIPLLIYIMPVIAILYKMIVSRFKSTDNKLKKFISFCFMVLPVLNLLAMIFLSNDVERWIGHAVLILFAGVMAFIKYDYTEGFAEFEGVLNKVGFPLFIGYIIFIGVAVF